VLTLPGKAGVTLKASKCHLSQEEVEYLGHVTRPGRVCPEKEPLGASGSPLSGDPDPDEEFSVYVRCVPPLRSRFRQDSEEPNGA